MYRAGLDLEGIVDNSYAFLDHIPGGDTLPRKKTDRVIYTKPRFNSVRDIPVYEEPRSRQQQHDPFDGGDWVDTRHMSNGTYTRGYLSRQMNVAAQDSYNYEEDSRGHEDVYTRYQSDTRTLDKPYNNVTEPVGSYLLQRTRDNERNHQIASHSSYLLTRTNHYLETIDRMKSPTEMKPKAVPPPPPIRTSMPTHISKRPSILPDQSTMTAPPPPPPPMPSAETLAALSITPQSQPATLSKKPSDLRPAGVIVPGLSDVTNARKNLRPTTTRKFTDTKQEDRPEPNNFKEALSRVIAFHHKASQRWDNYQTPPVLEANQPKATTAMTDEKYKTVKTLSKKDMREKLSGILLKGPQKPSFRGGQEMEAKRKQVTKQFLSSDNKTYTVEEPITP